MKNNKVISKIVLVLLLVAVTVSAVSCGRVEATVGNLPNQVINQRYYYQQGYDTDWEANFDSTEYMLDNEIGLLFKAWPSAAKDKVEYRVYYKEQIYTGLGVSTDAISYIMNESHRYYFNTYFVYEDGVQRENFVSELNYNTVRYNKMQFFEVNYEFTKNGEDWKGVYNMIMKANDCFIITFEALKTEYDTYKQDYVDMMNDWRKVGWETKDDKK